MTFVKILTKDFNEASRQKKKTFTEFIYCMTNNIYFSTSTIVEHNNRAGLQFKFVLTENPLTTEQWCGFF